MTEKKPYSPPQLFHVELSQEQAILSACSLTTTNVSSGGGRTCRAQGGGCKRHKSSSGDSGPRTS
jgi:hypothetical protein